ncbi:hypothetical protein SAMN05216350_104316 [Polaromonas sp. YR568]|uniref:hypothetical protein n=1 Tax=Polaromonas sp. YR568 TaxID=1855301 RepID=UPI0008E972B0|nr:hypothetical protein [Polaromonas sp. YR568]SFU74563.1 hypothetical protein SAMN05216350_104316 [Polaromonas sp. YR568]
MAYTYLFFEPTRLPLISHELGEATVRTLNDADAVKATLARIFPAIEWADADGRLLGRTQVEAGPVEFWLPAPGHTLSMRCSLRADYSADVQHLCDQSGWLAFDERPMCLQPGQAPIPA